LKRSQIFEIWPKKGQPGNPASGEKVLISDEAERVQPVSYPRIRTSSGSNVIASNANLRNW